MLLLLACVPPPPVAREISAVAVPMPDGVKLAVDVLLPMEDARAAAVGFTDVAPTVLVQARYWRSFATPFPERPGEVPVSPDREVTTLLLRAGYAVVLADVRGTGASEGDWQHPWSEQEIADGGALIDWIVSQPWSDGRVGTYGVSYAGTTALLAASTGRPALKAALAREVEWRVVEEIIAPGGVRNAAFIAEWGRATRLLDKGRAADFFPSPARYLLSGPRPLDADPDGVALAALQAARRPPDIAAELAGVRRASDPWGTRGFAAGDLGPAPRAATLAESKAALGIWGGWWDGATGDAVLQAWDALPNLVDARVGGWDHEGAGAASPLPVGAEAVDPNEIVDFFDTYLRAVPPDDPGLVTEAAPEPAPVATTVDGNGAPGADGAPPPAADAPRAPARPRRFSWYEAGSGWKHADAPPTGSLVSWQLGVESRLEPGAPRPVPLQPSVDHTTGPDNRWMAGLLRPVAPSDATLAAPGLQTWTTGPFDAPLRVFGAPNWTCVISAEAPAALHAYLDIVRAEGTVSRLTEGITRIEGHIGALRLLPTAAELPRGAALRLGIAAADQGTFEEISSTAPRLTVAPDLPCTLDLPTLPGSP